MSIISKVTDQRLQVPSMEPARPPAPEYRKSQTRTLRWRRRRESSKMAQKSSPGRSSRRSLRPVCSPLNYKRRYVLQSLTLTQVQKNERYSFDRLRWRRRRGGGHQGCVDGHRLGRRGRGSGRGALFLWHRLRIAARRISR